MFIHEKTNLAIHADLNETVIKSTLRAFDLYGSFLEVIKDTPEYASIALSNIVPLSALDDEDDAFWDSDECIHVMQELSDILNSYAPDGYYFGSHEGNSSDFGYWKINEA